MLVREQLWVKPSEVGRDRCQPPDDGLGLARGLVVGVPLSLGLWGGILALVRVVLGS